MDRTEELPAREGPAGPTPGADEPMVKQGVVEGENEGPPVLLPRVRLSTYGLNPSEAAALLGIR